VLGTGILGMIMTQEQWNALSAFKADFKKQIEKWAKDFPNLGDLQKQAALEAKTPEYSFERPVVYNIDLDRLTQDDEIKLIVIGDNPGKDEQLSKNQRYLVGQAGKIADGFFKRNPELGIDFRKNVVILNKTPVHSAKTAQLKRIAKLGGDEVAALLVESQVWMAKKTAELHRAFCQSCQGASRSAAAGTDCELWLVGYSELKEKALFTQYREALKQSIVQASPAQWDKVYVFQHFSMNRFTIDLADYEKANGAALKNKSLIEKIHQLGILHKTEIFGK